MNRFTLPDLEDLVLNTGHFDRDWYLNAYPDVAGTGMPASAHFVLVGAALGRAPSRDREAASTLSGLLQQQKLVSYCIPIMNRGDDIRGTLAANLNNMHAFLDKVEVILVFLDRDAIAHDWVFTEFAEHLRSGLLRVIFAPPLPYWHFCHAKNAFKPYLRGLFYSSLDGDNFVTAEETEQLLGLVAQFGTTFVFHHFSGDWGDGSSGRVSTPRSLYVEVGYDDRLMPRQYDENDFLLSCLRSDPSLRLVRHDTKAHIFGSKRVQAYLATQPGLEGRVAFAPPVARREPLNPRGTGYVSESRQLKAMTAFNQAFSYWKNSPAKDKGVFLNDAVIARHELSDALSPDELHKVVVKPARPQNLGPSAGLAICACVKNDDEFLPIWYDHYRSRGVERFFIIDDGSKNPIAEILPYEDVEVYSPSVGAFAAAKGLWIDTLMRSRVEPGSWVFTVDADEFIDLPIGFESFKDVIEEAERRDLDWVGGLMVDVVPSTVGRENDSFYDTFLRLDSVCWMEDPASESYKRHPAIAWGFGHYADLSWRIDARFHAAGAVDSLRKIPLVKTRPHLHVNQGFHDLHFSDSTPRPGLSLWDEDLLLSIRHYKTTKVFNSSAFRENQSRLDHTIHAYHARTSGNLRAVFGSTHDAVVARFSSLPITPYSADLVQRELRRLRSGLTRSDLVAVAS